MAEFEVIKRYFAPLSATVDAPDVVLGIGDDCALISPPEGYDIALSSDTLVADVHFFSDANPEDIGHKALAVNLSDLAAMGATPAWFSLNISLPTTYAVDEWLKPFCAGMQALAQRYSIPLVGGDTTSGPLTITLQVAGWVPKGQGLRRSGARLNDRLYVTGDLGWPALGLDQLAQPKGMPLRCPDVVLQEAEIAYAVTRLVKPTPQLAFALKARDYLHSAIDISDGLTQDLQHILTASQLSAQLDVDALPVAAPLRLAGLNTYWRALNFGDEYQLLLTAPAAVEGTLLSIADEVGITLSGIGSLRRVTANGLSITAVDGAPIPVGGYHHL